MKIYSLLLLLVVSCSPLMSPEEASIERQEVTGLLASGEITQQQADWRMEDIARMEAYDSFDIRGLLEIAILILGGGSLGTIASLTSIRLTRGPAKKASPAKWAAMQKATGV